MKRILVIEDEEDIRSNIAHPFGILPTYNQPIGTAVKIILPS